MSDLSDQIHEQIEAAEEEKSKLNTVIALSVALTATFMAICNVKNGAIDQALTSTQTQIVDTWSYFQAKSTKQGMADSFADELLLERDGSGITPEQRERFDKKIADLKTKSDRYEKEKGDLQKKAEDLQKDYDKLNARGDQFAACEASLSVGIALMGVTALTKRKWLLAVSAMAVLFGLALGISGFAGWNFRPEWLMKLLGA